MSRNNLSGSRTKVMEIERFGGENTAASFTEIDIAESPKMLNVLPNALGGLGKRPGSVPVSHNPINGSISRICNLRRGDENYLLVTSGTNLYRFDGVNFYGQQMTAPLIKADIDYAQFKNDGGDEVIILTDGGKLKAFNGTEVFEIGAAPNEAEPIPPNALNEINTNHKPIGCVVHNTRVVIWDGSDTIWHSRIGQYDYYAQTDFQRFVRENDYIQTCVSYRGALLVFLRRHIAVLFNDGYSATPSDGDWSQDFLDTSEGCIAPKTVETVTFPDGNQEVFYVSDNGVNSVFAIDTLSLDSSARYSTKNISSKQIDWKKLGITKDELRNAVATFHEGKYWLVFKNGTEFKGFVYDTNLRQWYPIDNVRANDFYVDEEGFYYVGDDGHLRKFDSSLFSDWNERGMVNNTPINMYWYSKMLSPKITGHDHFWDILTVSAKIFPVPSTIDVEVNTYRNQFLRPSAVITAAFVWGVTKWGEAEWANQNFTDLANNPGRLRTFVKGQYAQIKLSNNRDEPVEIYGIRYEVRTMDTYY